MKWTLGIFCIFFISCKNEGKHSTYQSTPEYIQVKLNPEMNKKYTYTIDNESEMVQEVNEQKFDNSSQLDIDVSYIFSKDTSGRMQLKMTYEKFKLLIKALDQEKELDASTASGSYLPSDKMFAAFEKATISAAIDSNGNVSNISGTDIIRTRMEEFAGNDLEARSLLNGSIKQYVGEQFFKQSMESCLRPFTSRRLKIGDTVMVTTPVGGELNISASVVYKLVSIKGEFADIAVSADVEIKDQILVVDNTSVQATISGKQKGGLKINVKSGMLEESETILDMKGTMQIMGREVPFKMKTRNSVSRIT